MSTEQTATDQADFDEMSMIAEQHEKKEDDVTCSDVRELEEARARIVELEAHCENLRSSLLKATTVFELNNVNRIAFEKLCGEVPKQSLAEIQAKAIEDMRDSVLMRAGMGDRTYNKITHHANQLRAKAKQ